MEKENETEKAYFKNADGILILKDVASRILLTLSFKYQLEGKYQKAEHLQKSVMENASVFFDLDMEIEKAKRKAIFLLTKEAKEKELKTQKANMTTQILPL